jgi:hypothetical protein
LEKKYDKMFQKITGISIYKTMRLYKWGYIYILVNR